MNDAAAAPLQEVRDLLHCRNEVVMPTRRTLDLSTKQRRNLIEVRDHHEIPYMREKAAALIKIADGRSPHEVAQRGLLRRRDPDTVYAWLNTYEDDGIDGLYVAAGRGRKPAFSP